MSAAGHSLRVFPAGRGRPIQFGLMLTALLALAPGASLLAKDQSGPCASHDAKSEQFLRCVAKEVQATMGKPAASILAEPLSEYLRQLTRSSIHAGDAKDLAVLKQRSTELKNDPSGNRAAIALLDYAIATHIDEFRSALSAPAMLQEKPAKAPDAGENLFPLLLKRKLDFLNSDRVEFYDRGPLEASTRVQLALSLEENYHVRRLAGNTDASLLERAQALITDALERLTNPQYDYLPDSQRRTWVNDYRFYDALLSFLQGKKDAARSRLRDLVQRNQDFHLGASKIDHIYLYKVFNTPYVLSVSPEKDRDGSPKVVVDDSALVRRNFNPAQLSLFVCSRLDLAGQDGVEQLAKDVGEFVLSDYYVVVASANERPRMETFLSSFRKALSDAKIAAQAKDLELRLAGLEAKGFSEAMASGAKNCGVDQITLDRVYSEFRLEPKVEEITDFGKYRVHMLMAGRLNASQARAVAEFINQQVFPTLEGARNALGNKNTAYIARMRIDG